MPKEVIRKLHHVGAVVNDIETATRWHVDQLGYEPEGGVIEERIQRVYVQFLQLGGFRLELLEPMTNESPVARFLARGGHINHLCYETADLDDAVLFLRRQYHAVPTFVGWSASMEQARVAFLGKPNGEVIELVQFVPHGLTREEAMLEAGVL